MTVFAADYTKTPVGPFTLERKQQVYAQCGTVYDADPTGKFFYIVNRNGINVLQMLYPEGQCGMQDQTFQVQLGVQSKPVSVSYKIRLRAPGGSDMASGPWKYAPAIQWGPIASTALTGIRQMITGGTANAWSKPRNFILQNQHTGGQLVQPPQYTPNIVLDQWDDITLCLLGGPGGYASFTFNGKTYRCTNMGGSINPDSVNIDFAHFAGGGAPVNRACDVYVEMMAPVISFG